MTGSWSVLIGRGGWDPIDQLCVEDDRGQPPRAERMTGLTSGQLAELVDRVREIVGPWENPPIGRPHA
jgi:hypothetical protein